MDPNRPLHTPDLDRSLDRYLAPELDSERPHPPARRQAKPAAAAPPKRSAPGPEKPPPAAEAFSTRSQPWLPLDGQRWRPGEIGFVTDAQAEARRRAAPLERHEPLGDVLDRAAAHQAEVNRRALRGYGKP